MASVNISVKNPASKTHGGAISKRITPEMELHRTVMGCMLWENNFYEDGQSVADRIKSLVPKVHPLICSQMAIKARTDMHLRHVPLLIVREMARIPSYRPFVADALRNVIQRADELCEFLAIYWQDDKNQPIAGSVKKGLAQAFTKFSAYDLAKYNRDGAVRLRDVMFLVHPKPINNEQTIAFSHLAKDTLKAPDTWEVALSSGANKLETFTRLIRENKLGGLAFLRNLRGMVEAGLSDYDIEKGFESVNFDKVLPFRFISAAKHAPQFESFFENALYNKLRDYPKLQGKTILVVDVSGSMGGPISSGSELSRLDAAKGLSMLLAEQCESFRLYLTAGNDYDGKHKTKLYPARKGFALGDVIKTGYDSLGGGGLFLTQCLDYIYQEEAEADRIIVITDEQDCDKKLNPAKANAFGNVNYLVNVGAYKNGIGYGKWTHIDGFSEQVVEYIRELENWGNSNSELNKAA